MSDAIRCIIDNAVDNFVDSLIEKVVDMAEMVDVAVDSVFDKVSVDRSTELFVAVVENELRNTYVLGVFNNDESAWEALGGERQRHVRVISCNLNGLIASRHKG